MWHHMALENNINCCINTELLPPLHRVQVRGWQNMEAQIMRKCRGQQNRKKLIKQEPQVQREDALNVQIHWGEKMLSWPPGWSKHLCARLTPSLLYIFREFGLIAVFFQHLHHWVISANTQPASDELITERTTADGKRQEWFSAASHHEARLARPAYRVRFSPCSKSNVHFQTKNIWSESNSGTNYLFIQKTGKKIFFPPQFSVNFHLGLNLINTTENSGIKSCTSILKSSSLNCFQPDWEATQLPFRQTALIYHRRRPRRQKLLQHS